MAIGLGCAREMPPPGTRPDEIPPAIVSIEPAPDSVIAGFDGRIEIRFDEPVRIPNGIARDLFASPMEPYEADMGFSTLRLRPEEGWRENVVYCYEIPTDGIADMIRNRMEASTEFCFSTGPEIVETAVSGSVVDALSGQALREARVIFWAGADSVPYGAVTDSVGEFRARGLPPGDYHAFGYIDQNRNFVPDRAIEAHDSALVTAAPETPAELRFAVVPPDTTPPLLARAVLAGGATVQLEFDDFLINPQPDEPQLAVRDSLGSELVIEGFLLGSADEVTFPSDTAGQGAAADSAARADSAALADSAGAAPPEEAPEGADAAAGDSADVVEEPILPSRFITIRLVADLDSATYFVEANGVVNVRQLVGGGDTSFVAEPAPPPEDTASVADSAALADTATVADTAAAAGPDTAAAAADTLGAPPDAGAGPPDASALRPARLRVRHGEPSLARRAGPRRRR